MAADEDLRQEIALEAYYRHLARGGAQEQDLDDWFEAERTVLERHRAAGEGLAGAEKTEKKQPTKVQGHRK